jgi:3-oxoacyl-[acyl-carrier protein] reductase
MNLSLEGKRAVVCGSTQGIGNATATELAHLGASITLVARNQEKLKQAMAALDVSKGQLHNFIVVDFAQPEDLRTKLQAYSQEFKAHILINNTGGPAGGPANAAHTDEYIQAFTNHLICNQILVQNLMEGMKSEGYGRIINIISTSVKQPLNGLGVSNTIRGAVANWAKTLSNELGAFNITVNNVLPGATNTVRLKSILENKAAKTGQTKEAVLEAMKNQVPMKRIAEAQEVANAIAFLASPAASYINGINVPVDGGRTACL